MALARGHITLDDQDVDILNSRMTGDGTRCSLYNPQSKHRSYVWKSRLSRNQNSPGREQKQGYV
jgi:hypothetical protein